ncbi:MAG: hypothetical protein U0518_00460 [Candidatus Gracilibacteria bacterium]
MQSKQKLHNYAIWYIGKYMPSLSRLECKLRERCDDSSMVSEVLDLVREYIDEPYIIRTNIDAGLGFGLGIKQIEARLMRRGFQRGMIRTISSEILAASSTENLQRDMRIQSMIERSIIKGESVSLIRMNLITKYREVQTVIDHLISSVDDRETLRIMFERNGVPSSEKELAKLQRKGFRYDDINRVIREIKG